MTSIFSFIVEIFDSSLIIVTVRHRPLKYIYPNGLSSNTIWSKYLITENNDEIVKSIVIHQNFPYQIFPLAIANVELATVLSIFYLSIFLNTNLSIFPSSLCSI